MSLGGKILGSAFVTLVLGALTALVVGIFVADCVLGNVCSMENKLGGWASAIIGMLVIAVALWTIWRD